MRPPRVICFLANFAAESFRHRGDARFPRIGSFPLSHILSCRNPPACDSFFFFRLIPRWPRNSFPDDRSHADKAFIRLHAPPCTLSGCIDFFSLSPLRCRISPPPGRVIFFSLAIQVLGSLDQNPALRAHLVYFGSSDSFFF